MRSKLLLETRYKRKFVWKYNLDFKVEIHLLLIMGKILHKVLTNLRVGVNVKQRNAEMNVEQSPILCRNKIEAS